VYLDLINEIEPKIVELEKAGKTDAVTSLKKKLGELEILLAEERVYNLESLLEIIPVDHEDYDDVLRDIGIARARLSKLKK